MTMLLTWLTLLLTMAPLVQSYLVKPPSKYNQHQAQHQNPWKWH
uniref:ATP synthase complex subunit 8 n=1 Tax=Paroedura picta TaxID=143630 RepID=A0A455VDE3_9SAUR|nr:ATPase subunit 8 [Paroedura picta]